MKPIAEFGVVAIRLPVRPAVSTIDPEPVMLGIVTKLSGYDLEARTIFSSVESRSVRSMTDWYALDIEPMLGES
jgi:hypothetical protein